jgi:hypothetical protein
MYLYTTPSARQLTIDCLVERVCLDPYVARTTVPRRAKLKFIYTQSVARYVIGPSREMCRRPSAWLLNVVWCG